MDIFLTKTRDVKLPERASFDEAGIDFFVPVFTETFLHDLKETNKELNPRYTGMMTISEDHIELFAHGRILIPSGILTFIPAKTCLQVNNKSGISSKQGLVYTAELIDHSYYGEIHLGVVNTSHEHIYIYPNQKLLQLVHLPVIESLIYEASMEEYQEMVANKPSLRGSRGIGSNFETQIKN